MARACVWKLCRMGDINEWPLKPSIRRARKNGPFKPRKEVEDHQANPLILQEDFQEEQKETKRPCKDWPRWSNLGHAWKQYYPSWYYPPWPPILTYGIKLTTRKPLPYHIYVTDLDLNAHMHEFKKRSLKRMVEWKTMALQTCLCLF
jgi:hypothetical protein